MREKLEFALAVATIAAFAAAFALLGGAPGASRQLAGVGAAVSVPDAPARDAEGNPRYDGPVHHVFFHSLVVYPALAFAAGDARSRLIENYMVTRDEFEKILPELYAKNFVLVDLGSLYAVGPDGAVTRRPIYLSAGKKPLVLSIDDVSYYQTQVGRGMARKLVLDGAGDVATEVVQPDGSVATTRDGDVVPAVDDFVAAHPDFSWRGAKGTLALTGYDGILGYRTQAAASTSPGYADEVAGAKAVVARLKATGWRFASHSYSHEPAFAAKTITLAALQADAERWDAEVRPLVGDTDIFIGPFGQVFSEGDPRRAYLVSRGFRFLCGVGVAPYLRFFGDHAAMDRADIDGFRLVNTPSLLEAYLDPATVIDALRPSRR